jgi:hypothetical protein
MSNINLLPTISSTASTYFITSQNNVAYRFSWNDLARSVQGIGPQGPQGLQGTRGSNGTNGVGTQGLTGAQGSGPQGTQGAQGTQAAQGTQGTAGSNPSFATAAVPASSTSPGIVGQIASDSNYIYFCVATNSWKKIYAPSVTGF